MGCYSRCIFPWLVDHVMDSPQLAEQRRAALAGAVGHVLEIGFGTGLNVPFYPAGAVRRITAVDANAAMARRAVGRVGDATFDVEIIDGDAAHLPLADGSFDTVVSTWTMCSIGDLPAALREVHRVLRGGGKLLFVEHGLAPQPRVAKWQHRLTPINRRLADGCHLDRDILGLIERSPLKVEKCQTQYLPRVPKVAGFTYRGVARRCT